MLFWVRNTNGKRDACLTFAVGCVVVCLLKVLFAGVSVTFGGQSYGLGSIDASIIGALLTPTLGAYVMRRYTDKVAPSGERKAK
jgi:hypothetical protein